MIEENLWGKLPLGDDLATPVSILRKQSVVLGELTGGLLTGRITSTPVSLNSESMMMHSLNIVAPALSNYSVEIVRVFHPPTLYPTKVRPMLVAPPILDEVVDESALKEKLAEILQDSKVHAIVRSLLAQVREVPSTSVQTRKSADVDEL
jgi:hypothetical protein